MPGGMKLDQEEFKLCRDGMKLDQEEFKLCRGGMKLYWEEYSSCQGEIQDGQRGWRLNWAAESRKNRLLRRPFGFSKYHTGGISI